MKFQVLISTMHQIDYSLLKKMNLNSDAVVVNQCDNDSKDEIVYNGNRVIWVNSKERGLSKSRNRAISEAEADVCLLADDDEEFVDNLDALVTNCFESHSKASIIRFMVKGIEKKFKNYPDKEKKIGPLGAMKSSSVEIAFKRKDIGNLRFDELIGAGTDFSMGEENAFLSHCFKKNLSMFFVPKIVANLHIGNSSWFHGYNRKYFRDRGAAIAAMENGFGKILMLQFAIRHWKLYQENLSFVEAMKEMIKGMKAYKEIRGCLK